MAGGSSGGHGFGVQKQKKEQRVVDAVMHRAGSKEALANDLQRLGRNEQHSRQRISYNTNQGQKQEIRKVNERPKMEMHRVQRMDATPNQRMTQTTRDNRTILEDAFRKQRRNKT